MTETIETNRVNRHGTPLSEIVFRPTKKEYANTPRLPLHLYPHVPLYQAPINLWQVRVKKHRISLDIIIAHHNEDYTIDDLVRRFDTLSRREIESVIGFYHDEKALVDAYIEYGEWISSVIFEWLESNFGSDDPARKGVYNLGGWKTDQDGNLIPVVRGAGQSPLSNAIVRIT